MYQVRLSAGGQAQVSFHPPKGARFVRARGDHLYWRYSSEEGPPAAEISGRQGITDLFLFSFCRS